MRALLRFCFFMLVISVSANAEELKIAISANELSELQSTEENLRSSIQGRLDQRGLGRQVVELSSQNAAMIALDSNISLQRGRLSDAAITALLQEARAVFDPKFVLSLDYQRQQDNERSENVKQYLSSTTVNDEGENVLVIDAVNDPRVPEVVYTDARGEGFTNASVRAHAESITGADEQLTIGAGLEQLLPWGGSLSLAYKAINNETFFINNPQLISGGNDVTDNLVGFGSYKRPWVSEIALSMTMPMPGAKGFGEYSSATKSRNRALLSQQQSVHELRSLVSSTLLSTDLAYWDLLEAALGLLSVQESMEAAVDLGDSTERLYQARSANNYDQAQIDLTLANMQAQTESQWSRYISASDRLSFLLNLDADSIIVPQGFSVAFEEESALLQTDDVDLNAHSRYLAQQSTSELLGLESRAQRQALMPDIQLSAEMALRQSNQVFGYADLSESLSEVFAPDIVTKSVAVTYTLPIANRALKAKSSVAEASLKQNSELLAAERITLESNLINAKTALLGAVSAASFSANAVTLREQSYTKALGQQRSRQVTEYELSGLHAALVQARLDHITALINVQREQTRLLDASDKLPESQAVRLASSKFERWRLAQLQQSAGAQMFLPQGGVK